MERYHPSPTELKGQALKDQVIGILRRRIEVPGALGKTLAEELLAHFDELPIDWNIARTQGEVRAFPPGVARALQYARLMTGNRLLDATEEQEGVRIKEVLQNSDMRRHFAENIWRLSPTFQPLRGIPLQYILRHEFGNEPITFADLGTGIHTLGPLFNSPLYMDTTFDDKDKIVEFAKPVTIEFGLGIDKHGREENIIWSTLGGPHDDESYARKKSLIDEAFEADPKQFPYLVVDLTNENDSIKKIRRTALSHGTLPWLNCVISSFTGYQLPDPKAIDHISTVVLKEKGILISSGEELANDAENLETYGVNVYRKTKGELVKIGTPFRIREYGEIVSVDTSYFYPIAS